MPRIAATLPFLSRMYMVEDFNIFPSGVLVPWNWSILRQMGISAAIVTAVEFVSGILLNMVLNLDVWDYSNMPFNIYGQICLPFTVIWFFLSFLAIVADDFLRWLWFGERFPEYHLFTKEE